MNNGLNCNNEWEFLYIMNSEGITGNIDSSSIRNTIIWKEAQMSKLFSFAYSNVSYTRYGDFTLSFYNLKIILTDALHRC